jgi:hypothetical protein
MKRALITVATGEYNDFIDALIQSSKRFFGGHFYIFTDQPNRYNIKGVTAIKIPHFGWPRMPLLRFEMLNEFRSIFKEELLLMIDSEAIFNLPLQDFFFDYRHPKDLTLIATLHRNITRLRKDFNYESRPASTAYISKDKGEKYYACGLIGGKKDMFFNLCETVSRNIREDINNGIRAIWGDESHINKFLINNEPTLVLPPNFMCPQGSRFFTEFITHRDKRFKRVWKKDTKKHLTINPEDYQIDWDHFKI